MGSDGCHGNHCCLDVKEEEEVLDTHCHGTVAEVGESYLQSVGAVGVDYGDEGAMAETVRGSVTSVGAGGMEVAHGDDDVAVVDDEAATASWRAATTLCESQDHY